MSTISNHTKHLTAFWKTCACKLQERISPSSIKDAQDIPIIINNFNRLDTLLRLTASLEQRGYRNIHILDNVSTYPPLLEYYQKCPYEVIFLHENLGFKALWKSKQTRKRFCNDYYIYTDSDVVLDESCPEDVISYLFRLLKEKYKNAVKIGLSLRIDNLPDHYAHKQKVIEWESRFYAQMNKDRLYRAPIDTTFALYRPHTRLCRSRFFETYRTAEPYRLRHLPWYSDSAHLTEEEDYYIRHCRRTTAWTAQDQGK